MTNPNEPAFPFEEYVTKGPNKHHLGISVREYFAALAMQAFLSREDMEDLCITEKMANVVIAADALIAELNKEAK